MKIIKSNKPGKKMEKIKTQNYDKRKCGCTCKIECPVCETNTLKQYANLDFGDYCDSCIVCIAYELQEKIIEKGDEN